MRPTRPRTLALLIGLAVARPGLGLDAPRSSSIKPEDRAHWAFVSPSRVDPPPVKEAGWVRNFVDRFVLSQLEAEGISHAPEADRATLLRRLSFDLIGLPPTPEESEAFLADSSPDAYDRQVDRLLASPHYGERQAQHWLDLARYADTDGFEFDEARPDAWRYRDWVVAALNRDLPYDRFLALQIAGDELEPENPESVVATGFNRCYPDMVDLNDQGLRRQNALDDITETVGLVALGLTIGCARCHDHKFDPISQVDFYSLQSFFTPARFRNDYPMSRPGQEPASAAKARVIDESGPEAPPTFLRRRGDYNAKGPEVSPAFPAILADRSPAITPLPRSSGRRSALAAWLSRPDHPLTARVIVNRVWQSHFGRGIVATPSDFGFMGESPSHPELLDRLALDLVDQGWSLKAVHRRIVTSATYRQSSRSTPEAALVDSDGVLLSRHPRRRLDGEAIRDALLAVSGRLNPALGGPCVFPELPTELTRLSSKGAIWPTSTSPEDRNRRSLYVFTRRNLRYPFFEAFDRPDTNASCPVRPVTTIAPQALSLLNGRLASESAQALAERVALEAGPEHFARIDRAYRLALARGPNPEESRLAREFLRGDPSDLEDFCLALLNLNEFVYVD